MKKNLKRIAISTLSGVVLMNSALMTSLSGTMQIVQAEEESSVKKLLDADFDDGSIGDFQIYIEGGDSDIRNEDGELVCEIRKVGGVNYANQLYLDGFSLREGCEYHISFDIRCDIERKFEYRLQMNSGSYRAYNSKSLNIGPENRRIECTFAMNAETDPAPRLVFNLGKPDNMKEDPGIHHVYIDNVQLLLTDESRAVGSDVAAENLLSVNQVGYLPEDEKIVVADGKFSGVDFEVISTESNEAVYAGTMGEAFYDKATDMEVCQGDFSSYSENGNYFVMLKNEGEETSASFEIKEGVYENLYRAAVRMLTYQRCGEMTEEYVGAYAHPACHTEAALIYGSEETKEVTGGWHDAGDFGRYVVPGAKAAADLLFTFEDNQDNPMILSDQLGIPESGNGIPDILDEVRYELEWMLKMQDEVSGGVYHKVTGQNFPGTIMPHRETAQMILSPISAAATADFAAIMAKASVDYTEVDADFSKTCLDAAAFAWEYLMNAESLRGFTNPSDIYTGEYGDGNCADEIFWAAVELTIADEKVENLNVSILPSEVVEEKMKAGVSSGLGWIEMGDYGLYELARIGNEMKTLSTYAETAKDRILAEADGLVKAVLTDGYFCSLGTGYYWGSNMNAANNGMLLEMAYLLSEKDDYIRSAKKQLDYLLGVNGTGYCYVTGFGSKATADPHHRPSQVVGTAVPGMLAGGPNKNLEDPYAKQILAGTAPGLCYVDNQQSYSLNEVAIYWNSPLIYLIAGI